MWKIYVLSTILAIFYGCTTAKLQEKFIDLPNNGENGKIVTRTVEHTGLLAIKGSTSGETISRQEPLKITDNKTLFGGGNFNWVDSLVGSISGWFTLLIILGVGGVALYIFVPVLQPFIAIIGRFIASAIPFIGSIVESIIAKIKYKKPLEQTVQGIENYKSDMTPEEKEEINASLKEKQDIETQKLVNEIKGK